MGLHIFILIMIIIFFAPSLRVVSEYQRLATFRLGRYQGLKGPGLVITLPTVDHGFKISVGDQGMLLAEGLGKFKTIELPVHHDEKLAAAALIKVIGFADGKVKVESIQN